MAPAAWIRRLIWVAGPGLVAMLADTDPGSIITVAQSGARWGNALLVPNLLLIPVMFVAQELALRLGLGSRQGAISSVRERFGRLPAILLFTTITCSCLGALVADMSGLAGAASAAGLAIAPTLLAAIAGLVFVLSTGSFRSVERLVLFVGLFELTFFLMAWRVAPEPTTILHQATRVPMTNPSYLYLLAANLGTSIIPWALFYQQSASVDKGLRREHLHAARLETLAGVVLCQAITSALMITSAATLGNGKPLDSVAQIQRAFTETLGPFSGHVIFVLGLAGSALVASVVVSLTLAWSLGEAFALQSSLNHKPREAPWFYAALAGMLLVGGLPAALGINLVRLTVATGVLNAVLMPGVLGVVYVLARRTLPDELQLRGCMAAVVAALFVAIAVASLGAAFAGLVF